MGAITGTKVLATEFPGQYKVLVITATPAAASDTITLTLATHGITAITTIVSSEITAGVDANLATCNATASGLVITLQTYNAAGGNATDWTGASVRIVLIGY